MTKADLIRKQLNNGQLTQEAVLESLLQTLDTSEKQLNHHKENNTKYLQQAQQLSDRLGDIVTLAYYLQDTKYKA